MTRVIAKEDLRRETGSISQKLLEELIKNAEPIERPGQNPLYVIEHEGHLYTVIENYFPDISGEKFTYIRHKKLNQH